MTQYAVDDKGEWTEVWHCKPPESITALYIVTHEEWVKGVDGGKPIRYIKEIQYPIEEISEAK